MRASTLFRYGLFLLSLLLLVTGSAWAQAQATTGVIEGTVTDPSGAVVPGAQITVTHVGTGFERRATTDENGFYRAVLLPLGTYRVTAEHSGFARLVLEEIEVTLGRTVRVDAQLKIAPAGEQVVVTAEEPLVAVAQTETSDGLGDRAVHELPTGNRNYLDYLTLTPNVHISMGTDGPQINVNGQKGVQTSFNVDGAGANNTFFGEQRGGQRPVANVVLEAVKEFQVVSEGAPPEFGGYSGAFINVVTKSGTNDLHGSVFYLQEAGALTWSLADNTRWRDYHREMTGASIGGPIVKDKLFFFGTYEQVYNNLNKATDLTHCCTTFPGGVATFTSPTAGGVPVNLADFFMARFGSLESGPIFHSNDLQAFLVKGDWHPNPDHTVTLRHYFARSIQDNGTFDVTTFGRTANGEEFSRSNAFIASWTWAYSPTRLNEFRFQYARDWRPREHVQPPDLPDTSIGPCTALSEFGSTPTTGCISQGGMSGRNYRFGRPFFHPSSVLDEQFQWNDNFTIIHGRHAVKVGFSIYHIRIKNFFQGFARGRYTFSSVEGFLNFVNIGPNFVECSDGSTNAAATCPLGTFITGPVSLYLQFTPIGTNTFDQASNNNFNQDEQGLFIQDTWQARPGLTLTYGLRWDNFNQRKPIMPPDQTLIGQFLADPLFPSDGKVPGYHKAFQPRFGLAWDPWNDGKTVFRLNGGVFFSRIPALMVANGTANNGSIAGTVFRASFLAPFGLAPPAYPDCILGPFTPPNCPTNPAVQPFDPGVVLFSEDFVYPRTYQGSFWVEREIARDWAISAGFNYAHATHLNRLAAFNHPPAVGVAADGRTFYGFGAGPFSSGGTNGPAIFGQGIAQFSGLITSQASSLYRAFTLKLDKRFSRGFLMTAHYTYSRDEDDDSNERDQFSFQYSDPVNFGPERGPSSRDQRHRFSLYALWNLPYGITWTNTFVAASARPRSALCNFDANGDLDANGDRVFTDGAGNYSCGFGGAGRVVELDPGQFVTLAPTLTNGFDTGRNSFRRDDEQFDWSMRLQKTWTFRERYNLIPMLEFFNITNHDNFRFPACDELQSCFLGTFLQIPGDPTRVRLGMRFEW